MPNNSAKILSKKPTVDFSKCSKCNVCVIACRINAIEKKNLAINETKCLRCFACAKKCPAQARAIDFSLSIIGKIFERKGKKQRKNILNV